MAQRTGRKTQIEDLVSRLDMAVQNALKGKGGADRQAQNLWQLLKKTCRQTLIPAYQLMDEATQVYFGLEIVNGRVVQNQPATK